MVTMKLLNRDEIKFAQGMVINHHYLHRPVDTRCSVEGYSVWVNRFHCAGYFLFGRPEATRCGSWYGSVDDVLNGRCEVTRWQILNLARVWLHPDYQLGGKHYSIDLPGYLDRKNIFRSTLASDALKIAVSRIGFDYLLQRPPCFLDEPYQIRYLISYCDTQLHKGTIYKNAGFELFRTNDRGIQTWRIELPGLTEEQDSRIKEASRINPRSIRYRAKRMQMSFVYSE